MKGNGHERALEMGAVGVVVPGRGGEEAAADNTAETAFWYARLVQSLDLARWMPPATPKAQDIGASPN